MCDVKQITKKVSGGIDADFLCPATGLPIIESNEFGMYCAKKCGLSADKKAKKQAEKFMKNLMGKP